MAGIRMTHDDLVEAMGKHEAGSGVGKSSRSISRKGRRRIDKLVRQSQKITTPAGEVKRTQEALGRSLSRETKKSIMKHRAQAKAIQQEELRTKVGSRPSPSSGGQPSVKRNPNLPVNRLHKMSKISRALGRIALPLGAAVGAYDTGKAIKVGYETFKAHRAKVKNEKYMKEKYGSIEAATRTRKKRNQGR